MRIPFPTVGLLAWIGDISDTGTLRPLGLCVWGEVPAAGSMAPAPLDSLGCGLVMLIDYKEQAWNWNFLGLQVPGRSI